VTDGSAATLETPDSTVAQDDTIVKRVGAPLARTKGFRDRVFP
jgi:hypothetical protein